MRKTRATLTLAAAAALTLTLTACGAAQNVKQDDAAAQEPQPTETQAKPAAPKPAPVKTTPPPPPPPPAPEAGTRENPAQPEVDVLWFGGYSEETAEYEVVIGKYDPDAWPEIQAENQFNDPPAEGHTVIMVPVTATYTGQDSGMPWMDLDFKFVTADGRSFDDSDYLAVIPNDLMDVSDLYNGGVGQGNVAFQVPSDAVEGGTIAVSYMWGDPMFVAAVPAE